MAQYVIAKQIAVEAESPEEAIAKINEGQTISLSVTVRPQQSGSGISTSGQFSHTQTQPTPPK